MVGPFIFFRSSGTDAIRARVWDRREAAPSHCACHGDLPFLRFTGAPRQPRLGARNPSRRCELDDGWTRHCAFGANSAGGARGRRACSRHSELGGVARRAGGWRTNLRALPRGDSADARGRRHRSDHHCRRGLWTALSGRHSVADTLCPRANRSRRNTRSGRQTAASARCTWCRANSPLAISQ